MKPADVGLVHGKPWVVIPTCGLSNHLSSLVKAITQGGVGVCVVLNNFLNPRQEMKVAGDVVDAGGYVHYWGKDARIYDIWNWALQMGRNFKPSTVSILNDDIQLYPGSVNHLDQVMRSREDLGILGWNCNQDFDAPTVAAYDVRIVEGSYRHGGIPGFAFMCHPDRTTLIDERFNWWGGDDDLFKGTVQKGWRLGIVTSEPVKHFTSTSANQRTAVYEGTVADRQLLMDKWGETW